MFDIRAEGLLVKDGEGHSRDRALNPFGLVQDQNRSYVETINLNLYFWRLSQFGTLFGRKMIGHCSFQESRQWGMVHSKPPWLEGEMDLGPFASIIGKWNDVNQYGHLARFSFEECL